MEDALTLAELAEETGLTPRAIRHLISHNLLRGPDSRGRYASYGRYHLDRLLAIRYLREVEGLSLNETAVRLESFGPSLVVAFAQKWRDGQGGASRPSDAPGSPSALEYLKSLRAVQAGSDKAEQGRTTSFGAPDLGMRDPTAADRPVEQLVQALGDVTGSPRPSGKTPGEAWFRIPVTSNVELHIRGYGDEAQLAAFERAADLLRHILLGGLDDDEHKRTR